MITIHHLGISQSERILWLCEELELPYLLKRYDRDATTGAAPCEYRQLHPTGTAPVISDGSVVLPESGAIVQYLLSKYGDGRLELRPNDTQFSDYLFWLHYANGSMMPHELVALLANAADVQTHALVRVILERRERGYAMIEERLSRNRYFAGDNLTAADIVMIFPLTTMRRFIARDISAFPGIKRYLAMIGERPAYQRAMAKGDPDMQPALA
jgi:glutathione S-transferase